jgi:hypothetical protein
MPFKFYLLLFICLVSIITLIIDYDFDKQYPFDSKEPIVNLVLNSLLVFGIISSPLIVIILIHISKSLMHHGQIQNIWGYNPIDIFLIISTIIFGLRLFHLFLVYKFNNQK